MKTLLISLIVLLCVPTVNAAGVTCVDDCKQILEGTTKDQAACLAKRDCGPQLKKKDAEIKKRDQEIVALKKQIEESNKEPKRKNRISLLAGQGPQEGLKQERNGSSVSVESKVGMIGGLQYQRLITDRVNLGLQLQTNKTILGSVGLDF